MVLLYYHYCPCEEELLGYCREHAFTIVPHLGAYGLIEVGNLNRLLLGQSEISAFRGRLVASTSPGAQMRTP